MMRLSLVLVPVCALAAVAVATVQLLSAKVALVRVVGASMEPTFTNGDRLLVRCGAIPKRGEVVVFANPIAQPGAAADPPWLVKRVVSVQGDIVPDDVRARVGGVGAPLVPRGCLVVRGDAERSQDSRHFGYVQDTSLLGVVLRSL